MSAFHTLSSNFNGGLVTPKMAGRFDLDKLKSGCVELKNMLVSPYGGVFKRPGTQYVQRVESENEEARLIALRATGLNTDDQSSTVTESVILELSGGSLIPLDDNAIDSLHAWADGDVYKCGDIVGVYNGGSNTTQMYYCAVDHTGDTAIDTTKFWTMGTALAGERTQGGLDGPPPPGSIKIPILNSSDGRVGDWFADSGAELDKVKLLQINDITFFVHPDAPPQRLIIRDGQLDTVGSVTRFKYRFEPVPFDFAPALDVNETALAIQIQYDYDSWVTSTSYVVGDRVIGDDGNLYTCYTAHTSSATDEPGVDPATANWDDYWNLGTSSATIPTWANATSYSAGDLVKRSGTIYECTDAHTSANPTSKNTYGWVGGNRPGTSQYWTRFWKVSGGTYDLSDVALRMQATEDLFLSSHEGTIWRATFGVDQGFRRLSLASTGQLDPTESLFVQGGYLVTTNWSSGSAVLGTLIIEESTDNKVWKQVKLFEINDATEGNISYTGDVGTVGAWVRILADVDTSRAGKSMYLEPTSSLLTLPVRIDTYTDATNVSCSVIMPGDQLVPLNVIGVATTQWRLPAFSDTQGYPAAIALHDLRLWFGGTRGQPARIWGSQTDDFYNFLGGALDTDAMDITLGATKRNEIKWLQSFNRVLVVGTNLQEWTIDGGDEETTIKPSTFRARLRTNYGSGEVSPIVIEEALLWTPSSGKKLLEFAYNFQLDGYTAPDLSIFLGPKLGVVKRMAFMRNPFPCLWVVNEDGQLFSFFYDRTQELTAWSIHLTGEDASDTFEDVVTTDETTNQVWFVVRRSLGNSQYGRFIEKMDVNLDTALASDENHDTGSAMSFDPVHLDCSWSVDPGQSGSNSTVSTSAYGPFVGRSLWLFQNGANFSIAGPSDAVPNSAPYNAVFPNFTNLSGNYLAGFQIKSTIQGFPVEVMLRDGTGQGRKWRPNRITFLMQNSHGGQYGDTLANATQPIEYPRTPAPVFTGRTDEDLQPSHFQADWRNYSQVAIVHNQPSPFGLLGYLLTLEVEGE